MKGCCRLLMGIFMLLTVCIGFNASPAAAQTSDSPAFATLVALIEDDTPYRSVHAPDPGRPNLFIDSIRATVVFDGGNMLEWIASIDALWPAADEDQLPPDPVRPARDRWIILVIGILILFSGILNASFPGDISRMVRAYYNNFLLSQFNKEDHRFGSWFFVLHYLLSGFAIAIFIYLGLVSGALGLPHPGGVESYLLIALSVILLFGLKIAALRLLGFVFDIAQVLRRYITVLYLGYFNSGIILLISAVIISLLPYSEAGWVTSVVLGSAGLFLFFRVIQVAVELLIDYRLPKFYLFMYLCTLEIGPVLILITVLYR